MLSEDKEFLIEFNAGGISPQALHSITLQMITRLVYSDVYIRFQTTFEKRDVFNVSS